MASFGKAMRDAHFDFAPSYTPLNHGSFGAYPTTVRDYQQSLQRETEARPDTFIRFRYPELLREARQAVAPLLGADTDEVVFVPNALTGINSVLRNLTYEKGDVILYFSTIYGACLNTIKSLEDTTPVKGVSISLTYPIEDKAIRDRFIETNFILQMQGARVRLALFDTVLTFPGVRFPWESLVRLCKQLNVLSCVDGAHGIGHIDLAHCARVGPDFFISNCYKWLMVPRGCAVLCVPRRNHHLIKTTYPTSEGYLPQAQREAVSPTEYFVRLFEKVSTVDATPYISVLEALKFREQICGGEKQIRDYCTRLAREGGELMAALMGTAVLENETGTLRDCCFTNVRLPLDIGQPRRDPILLYENRQGETFSPEEVQAMADWITERSVNEFDSFLATRFYAGAFWTRLSSQIYLDRADFEWAAKVLLDLCDRARKGEWRSVSTSANIQGRLDI
ncbi:Uu.00g126990.m01.CDS01 [Anthostomella pinea]|uniref:Uu.00g126990.m01.CDS01 n=1 Tax=Anthostomella pinea TaxID=933095 RepID=A0AAI8VIZ9_9PEZI|nr:Uu.00g126990.m01.CDS01 [Anthostomella pinea]